VGEDVVADGAGLNDAGQRMRSAPVATLQFSAFSPRKGLCRHRPTERFGAVVGGIHDNGDVFEAEFLELVEQLADVAIVLDHAVRIDAQAGLPFAFLLEVRPDVHARGVPPEEERLVRLLRPLHIIQRELGDFVVNRLHAFDGQRAVITIFWCRPGWPNCGSHTGCEFLSHRRSLK